MFSIVDADLAMLAEFSGIRWIEMPCAEKNTQKCRQPKKQNSCALCEKLELRRKNKMLFFLVSRRSHLPLCNLLLLFHIIVISLPVVIMTRPVCFLLRYQMKLTSSLMKSCPAFLLMCLMPSIMILLHLLKKQLFSLCYLIVKVYVLLLLSHCSAGFEFPLSHQ